MAEAVGEKRIVLLLRAPKDSEEEDSFVEVLTRANFRVLQVPVIDFKFLNQAALVAALLQPQNYSGVIFTSPRTVKAVAMALTSLGLQAGEGSEGISNQLRCFVVGPSTAAAAREVNFHPEGSESGHAGNLAQFILDSVDQADSRPLLFPCAKKRRDTLPDKLHDGGLQVEEIAVYETVPNENIVQEIKNVFTNKHHPDSVVFFSPSGVDSVTTAVDPEILPLHNLKVYAIGPVTGDALISLGYPVRGVAANPSPDSLLQVLDK